MIVDPATCLREKAALRKLDKEAVQDALVLWEEARAHHARKTGGPAGDIAAAREVSTELAARQARRKLLKARQIVAADRAVKYASEHPKGFLAGIRAMLSKDWSDKAGYLNVEYLGKSLEGQYGGMWANGIDRFRTKYLWSRDKAGERDLVRALFGEDVAESARELAESWKEVAEYARTRAVAAGAELPKLENWRLPQPHDARRIAEAGAKLWKDHVRKAVQDGHLTFAERPAPDQMELSFPRDNQPTPEEELEALLDGIYETLSTDGLNQLVPGKGSGQGRKLADRHVDHHRVLQFQSADAWLAYNKAFGGDDIFGTMRGHLKAMAHETALLEIMGPDPEAMRRLFQDLARHQVKNASEKAKDAVESALDSIDNHWNEVNGKTAGAKSGRLARNFGHIRNMHAATKLGGAFLSAVSDVGTSAIAAKFNGLKTRHVVWNYARALADSGDRAEALRMGYLADVYGDAFGGGYRYTGEWFENRWSARLADNVMRASFLKQWTEAGQAANVREWATALGQIAQQGKELGDIENRLLREALQRYGVTADDWKAAQDFGLTSWREGVPAISAVKLARSGNQTAQDAALKIQRMILTERDQAVLVPDARTRALMNQGLQRGTWRGEILRSLVQFKTFPMTMLTRVMFREFNRPTWPGKLGHTVFNVAILLPFGALALQAKEIAKGREPREMNSKEFLGAAMMQSGGAGILGDFLFSDQNRFGGSLASTLSGPSLGTTEQFSRLTIGNIQEAIAGEDMHIGAEAVDFVKSNMVPGSSLWYARLAFDRVLWDQLSRAVDPRFDKRVRRMERKARRDYGQEYWWRPGEMTPEAMQ